ncbi:MAG: hypothetical protein FJ319_02810 [SAR202 cluster bacterium]|nr:hypothetical protein [SAR202 cluster bacterium]
MAKRRPNLLFIMTDQQRPDTMACYGNKVIRTPNLDALASGSLVFEHGYVTQPVCTPSRSSIMTGLYPHTNGCTSNETVLDAGIKTMGELAWAGYTKGYHGKWQLGDERTPKRGFTDWRSMEDGYGEFDTHEHDANEVSDYHKFLVAHGFTPKEKKSGSEKKIFSRKTSSTMPEQYTKAAFLGNEAVRFLKETGDRPFILYTSFLEPHAPFNGPLNDMYPRDNLNTGPAFLRPPPADASIRNRMMAAHWREKGHSGQDLTTEAGWREIRARYFGLVTLVDRQVGRIMRALDETGQADNTIVVYTSDHGDMQGDHCLLTKTVLYEEAVKVPYIIRAPWIGNGKVPGRVSNIDLVPTLLELMGEDAPANLHGKSLVPVMKGKKTLADNDVVVQWSDNFKDRSGQSSAEFPPDVVSRVSAAPWRSIVTGDNWKLNLSADDQPELYDLNTDPHELDNKFDDPAQKPRIRAMAARVGEWQARNGDTVNVFPAGVIA